MKKLFVSLPMRGKTDEEIVGTVTAVDTFLGVLLGISTAQYRKTQE